MFFKTTTIICKWVMRGSSTTVLGNLSTSLPQAPVFEAGFQPLSTFDITVKQKSKDRRDVENDMRLVLTNTPPRISRLVAQLQAQSSHWLAWVLSVMHMNVNTVNATCKMVCFYLVGCYLNPFRVVVNGWGRVLISYSRMGSRADVIFSNGVASLCHIFEWGREMK